MQDKFSELRMLVVRNIVVVSITRKNQMVDKYTTVNRCPLRLKMANFISTPWNLAEQVDIRIQLRANRKYLGACLLYSVA